MKGESRSEGETEGAIFPLGMIPMNIFELFTHRKRRRRRKKMKVSGLRIKAVSFVFG